MLNGNECNRLPIRTGFPDPRAIFSIPIEDQCRAATISLLEPLVTVVTVPLSNVV